jgi:multidrug efflux pump subunit AcrA (membrane-fusion protein)
MLALVTLPVGPTDLLTMVPKDALVLGTEEQVVWVVEPDDDDAPTQGTASRVPVGLGVSYDGWIEVRGPLEPGQLVVIEGNERLVMDFDEAGRPIPPRVTVLDRRGSTPKPPASPDDI